MDAIEPPPLLPGFLLVCIWAALAALAALPWIGPRRRKPRYRLRRGGLPEITAWDIAQAVLDAWLRLASPGAPLAAADPRHPMRQPRELDAVTQLAARFEVSLAAARTPDSWLEILAELGVRINALAIPTGGGRMAGMALEDLLIGRGLSRSGRPDRASRSYSNRLAASLNGGDPQEAHAVLRKMFGLTG